MKSFSKPHVLSDYSLLSEIEQLRLDSWAPYMDNLSNAPVILHADPLDYVSTHFIVTDAVDKIIAANRITKYKGDHIPPYYPLISSSDFESDLTIAYYSKLVIHPDYRKTGIKQMLDEIRISWSCENNIDIGYGLYGVHRMTDVLAQGFVFCKKLDEGTERFFPFFRRELNLMSISFRKINPINGFSNTSISNEEVELN